MEKRKLLFTYHSMIIGGSTTSLLALLNNLDPERYEVDLQLFRNKGPLLHLIPEHVNLLPAAEMHRGRIGKLAKLLKFVFKGYAFKYLACRIRPRDGARPSTVLGDFQAAELSRQSPKHYDCAIGFMEGWSDKYAAFKTDADTKYAWLHSTFSRIAPGVTEPPAWMKRMDKIILVSDACREQFAEQLPTMADKAVTIENITDDGIIRRRAEEREADADLERFMASDAFKIITVCRLTVSVKGLDRIVSCAKTLKAEGINFLWYIVGGGEDAAELEAMITEAGVGDRLVAVGTRFNPYPFIKAADIMCMPSRYEGKPMVVTESMILGVPPVVTEYLSAREQINDGTDGVVVENNDEAITDAVVECTRNRDKILAMKSYLLGHEYGNKSYVKEIEAKLFE